MVNRFTSKSQQVLQSAKKSAEKMGHTYIGTEHLLLGILNTECIASKLLYDKKITLEETNAKVLELCGAGSFSNLSISWVWIATDSPSPFFCFASSSGRCSVNNAVFSAGTKSRGVSALLQ